MHLAQWLDLAVFGILARRMPTLCARVPSLTTVGRRQLAARLIWALGAGISTCLCVRANWQSAGWARSFPSAHRSCGAEAANRKPDCRLASPCTMTWAYHPRLCPGGVSHTVQKIFRAAYRTGHSHTPPGNTGQS